MTPFFDDAVIGINKKKPAQRVQPLYRLLLTYVDILKNRLLRGGHYEFTLLLSRLFWMSEVS